MQPFQRPSKQKELDYKPATQNNLPTINGIPIQPINLILPQSQQGAIYIGDVDAAKDINTLRKYNIRAVLTVAPDAGISYSKRQIDMHQIIKALDQDYYNLSQHFMQSYEFIDRARKRYNVLVHCLAGVSRSVSLVIAYLMKKYNWRTDKAYQTVKSKRRLACPNLGFCKQLKEYQKQLGLVQNHQNSPHPIQSGDQQQSQQYPNISLYPPWMYYAYQNQFPQSQQQWNVHQIQEKNKMPYYPVQTKYNNIQNQYTYNQQNYKNQQYNLSNNHRLVNDYYSPSKSPHLSEERKFYKHQKSSSKYQYNSHNKSKQNVSQTKSYRPYSPSYRESKRPQQNYKFYGKQQIRNKEYKNEPLVQTNRRYQQYQPKRIGRNIFSYSSYGNSTTPASSSSYYEAKDVRLNSPRKNYRPYQYGNYNRIIKQGKERKYIRSPQKAVLRSSSIRSKGLKNSRMGQKYRNENINLSRSKVGYDFDIACSRNYSIQKFVI